LGNIIYVLAEFGSDTIMMNFNTADESISDGYKFPMVQSSFIQRDNRVM